MASLGEIEKVIIWHRNLKGMPSLYCKSLNKNPV